MRNEELKHNLTSGGQWLRLLFMVLFYFLLQIAGLVMLAVVALQFLFAIITGGANGNLRRLGDQIASYIYQTLQFLIYNTEEKPFPFSEWPESDVEDLSGYESTEEALVLGGDGQEEEQHTPEKSPARNKSSTVKPTDEKEEGGEKE